jgi:hypothetical protein
MTTADEVIKAIEYGRQLEEDNSPKRRSNITLFLIGLVVGCFFHAVMVWMIP